MCEPDAGSIATHVNAQAGDGGCAVAGGRVRADNGRSRPEAGSATGGFVTRDPAEAPLLLDPRAGDVEDDASSTKSRRLSSLAGSMLAEISLPKFVAAWLLLVGLPGLLLGLAPLALSLWIERLSDRILALSGFGSLLLIGIVATIGWVGARPVFRLAERSFWDLHSLALQPGYALCREGLSHVGEMFLQADADEGRRMRRRAATAALAGLVCFAAAASVVALLLPHTRWTGEMADLTRPLRLLVPAFANAGVIVGSYLALVSLVWGFGDALMDQPRLYAGFVAPGDGEAQWRVAHLSDIHVVGERYGFRIESGRVGPCGNGQLRRALACLAAEHAREPLDLVLITGDMTDAGRSAEWAEFLDLIAPFPDLVARMLILPGNHDVNVVDRANPARLELPLSPIKRLRQMRSLAMMAQLQGGRCRVVWRGPKASLAEPLGPTLLEALAPHAPAIASLADRGGMRISAQLAGVWADAFPLVLPPATPDGFGVIVLNSNAETNFSFTNALGLVAAEDVAAIRRVLAAWPQARFVVALHHHLMEYPMKVKAFSERIGTALINGSWFVRQLQADAHRLVVMHGHRHIDWVGAAGRLRIVSAPSPVMEAREGDETSFLVHRLVATRDGGLGLAQPQRIVVPGSDAQLEAQLARPQAGESGSTLTGEPPRIWAKA